MDWSRRRLLSVLTVTGGAFLAGCSSGSQPSETATRQVTRTATPPPSTDEPTKLVPDDGDSNDGFGRSVAVSADGSVALVGARDDEDPNGEAAGSAYVFEATDDGWRQQAKLAANDGDAEDWFGSDVALAADGSRALVTAYRDSAGTSYERGAVYVFEADDDGWRQQAKLTPPPGEFSAGFGSGLALAADGRRAVVGAFSQAVEDSAGEQEPGAVHVYVADDDWERQATLTPSDDPTVRNFGIDVAADDDGTTVLVGANFDATDSGTVVGSAYIFEYDGGEWVQRTAVTPADGAAEDRFGSRVALSADGRRALVTAREDDNENGEDAGAVYGFERVDGRWHQRTKLTPDDGGSTRRFGFSVSMTGDGGHAIVGAGLATRTGSVVYRFERTEDGWRRTTRLTAPDGDTGNGFGWSVALSSGGETGVVGAPFDDPTGVGAGSAYVLE